MLLNLMYMLYINRYPTWNCWSASLSPICCSSSPLAWPTSPAAWRRFWRGCEGHTHVYVTYDDTLPVCLSPAIRQFNVVPQLWQAERSLTCLTRQMPAYGLHPRAAVRFHPRPPSAPPATLHPWTFQSGWRRWWSLHSPRLYSPSLLGLLWYRGHVGVCVCVICMVWKHGKQPLGCFQTTFLFIFS